MNKPDILIAVSDLFFLSKIKTALESQGCTVRVGSQSESLLKMALERPPSLLILDLGLGTLDPAAFIDALRGTPESAPLPVLCYTNHTRVPDWEKKLSGKNVKVVPNSYISSEILNIVGLISTVMDHN